MISDEILTGKTSLIYPSIYLSILSFSFCSQMQMRFDGYIGFPGGLVDSGEDQITALNRELLEEMNLDTSTYKVTEENHIVSHYSTKKNICLHFYALEVPEEDIKKIEVKSLSSKDHGSEVRVILRHLVTESEELSKS